MARPKAEQAAEPADSGRVPLFHRIQFKYAVTYLLLIALVLLLLNTYPLLMAQNMVFRSKEKTLEEAEVSAAMKRILDALEKMGIELRQ